MNKNSFPYLKLLEGTYSLCKVSNEFDIHSINQVFCIMKESDVTTLIYKQDQITNENFLDVSHGWKVLRVEAKLDFSQTGILYSVIAPLSKSEISILAVSTFDTDYIFLKEEKSDQAIDTLKIAGYQIKYE